MENRIAILGILVNDRAASGQVNELLHDYGDQIIGRMGIPHRGKCCSIITIVMDCPNDTINALCGKLGRLPQVQVKAMLAK